MIIIDRHYFIKSLSVCIIASFLLWIIYQLLMRIKLGSSIECLFMAQVCVVLLIAPYLAAYTVHTGFSGTRFSADAASSTTRWLTHNHIFSGKWLSRQLVMSQGPVLSWVFLSTFVALCVTNLPFTKALQIVGILGIYSVSAGAVGMCGAYIFRDALFGAEFATLLWCGLIGGAFLLNPLQRYVDNLQPFIAPVLHLNPLMAVCGIFEGMDIFRKPMLYELTPVTSYDYRYPNPWYLVGVWQLVIGGCCFVGTWRVCIYRGYNVQGQQKG
ncbi:hypothetical protein F4009_16865 [Candidatus Poribacteria bacterium]|nr:hypothetical protein [Candidatus Poribacteria bacterium]MYH82017.1 hypothetical protein [Candidatus Poribacteria bacterium]MYK95643.1 hypothetical protein [Candidatus Poribacteria bacterium]